LKDASLPLRPGERLRPHGERDALALRPRPPSLFHKLRLGDARFRGVDASLSDSPSTDLVAPDRESTSSVSAPESDPFNPRPNPPPVNASMSSSYAHRDAVKSPYVACAYRTSPSRDPRTLPSLLTLYRASHSTPSSVTPSISS
jgi:hypothetical protein